MSVQRAATILDYLFRDESLLSAALTHASSADHRLQSNERLEFLGDAILGYLVCEYLFRNYPDLLEGDLTKIKSAVVSRKVCAQISEDLDLCSLINLGKGMSGRAKLPGSVAAAALESIIAAIYLDGGMDAVRTFVLTHFLPHINEAAESTHQFNFKSVLQQYAQKFMSATPHYVVMDEKGPDHAKAFEVCVEIAGRRYASAWAQSKKEAEQKAALETLHELELASTDENGQTVIRDRSSAQSHADSPAPPSEDTDADNPA